MILTIAENDTVLHRDPLHGRHEAALVGPRQIVLGKGSPLKFGFPEAAWLDFGPRFFTHANQISFLFRLWEEHRPILRPENAAMRLF
jgi:hypothetical protein